ncbi:MAG: site-specific integrase [Actinomycetota bacterium]|nr:site-specific integrase [Actinomycetota bacterium]
MSASQRTPKRVRVDGVPNLYQRPVDGKFEVGYTGSDGKWHIKTLTATTLTEAKKQLHQLLGKRDRNEDVAPTRLTLNEVADEFFKGFDSKVARGERSPSTLTNYRMRWDTHIRPTFGRKQIQSVRVSDVSRLMAELRRKTKSSAKNSDEPELLSNWSVLGVLQVLGTVFDFAVRHEYVASNPVQALRGEKPQAKNKTEARILEAHEVRALLDSAPEKYRLLLMVTAYTGLRQSEVLGLRWQDVDFENSVLHVRHQLSRAKADEPAKLKPLKTRAGERWIELAPELSRELAKHSLASSFSHEDDFVFTTDSGKPLYYRNVSARGLDKAADRAGLNRESVQKLSFHDLRHTAITHLIRSGADPAQVSRFAGHSKVSTTLDLYVGEWEKRRANDSGTRLAAIYSADAANA